MITNSLSDFSSYLQKTSTYIRDTKCKNTVWAYRSDGSRLPLRDCDLNDVELVAGVWRVQNKIPYNIENVRKKDFVIGKKLPYTERTLFDFYEAYAVSENCYGKYMVMEPKYIVAKYVTNRGVFSAYGRSIEDARAYLGIKLYDEFQEVIHREINAQHKK